MRREKLGSEAKLLLSDASPSEEVDVLVRLREEPDESAVERLAQAGLTLRTTAGDVATATLRLEQLEDVTDLDDVVSVELSRPLHREQSTGRPPIED